MLLLDISVKLLYFCLLLFDVIFVFSEIIQIYVLVNIWIGELDKFYYVIYYYVKDIVFYIL